VVGNGERHPSIEGGHAVEVKGKRGQEAARRRMRRRCRMSTRDLVFVVRGFRVVRFLNVSY
jgi:hypothetical protein